MVLAELHDNKPNENIIIVAGISFNGQANNYYPVYKSISDCKVAADVILDFSNINTLYDNLNFAKKTKTPLVIATTGFSEKQVQDIEEAAKYVPILRSANMSLGINLIVELVKEAAATLKDFDVEIVDIHHNQKIDSPSGTALLIADAINETREKRAEYEYNRHEKREKRKKDEIGIHSIRGGNIVGDHTIIFAGQDEVVEITHKAASRDLFARGAIKAAEFIVGQPAGRLYSMKDVVKTNRKD
jgi:4-hydroxy-tetrahydrodipicolinate reductase